MTKKLLFLLLFATLPISLFAQRELVLADEIWVEYAPVVDASMFNIPAGATITILGIDQMDNWAKISYGDNKIGYLASYLLKTRLEQESPGQDPEALYAQLKSEVEVATYNDENFVEGEEYPQNGVEKRTIFNGWKAGKNAVWLVIAASILLMALTIYRWFNWGDKILTGKLLMIYAWMLLLVSALEIWYMLSLGVEQGAWFIGREGHGAGALSYILLIIVGAHQIFALFTYTFDVQINYSFRFVQGWTLFGLLFGAGMYGITKFMIFVEDTEGSLVKFSERFTNEEFMIVCVAIGLIPQILQMLWSYFRQTKGRHFYRIFGIATIYFIALIGTVCIGTLTIAVVAAFAVCFFIVYLIITKGASFAFDQTIQTLDGVSSKAHINAEIGFLEDRIKNSNLSNQDLKKTMNDLETARGKANGTIPMD